MNPIALRFGFWVLAPPLLIAAIGFGLQGLAAANSALFFTWGFFLEVLLAGLLQGVLYALVALGFVLIFKASGIFNFAQGSMVLFAALTLVGFIGMGLHWTLAFIVTAGVMVLLAMVVVKVVLRPLVNQPHIILFMATSLFNLAQWPMFRFAAVALVGFIGMCLHWTLAFIVTAGVMGLLAMVVGKVVLRPLVNQPHISLFMATIGIFYFLDGFGQMLWGSDVKMLDIGITKETTFILEGVFEGGILVNGFDLVAALEIGRAHV